MSKGITIVHDQGKPSYPIYIENDFKRFFEALEGLNLKEKKVCIVTDTTVAGYYLDTMCTCLSGFCAKVVSYTFPAGEASKNLNTVSKLYERLIDEQFDRKDVLLALGGGVVGDLTGFTAATYLRGIRFIQVPTTLLSMVDSSIGGKTGVDFQAYKNMVGAFHQPSAVYINLSLLLTLTNEQYYSGMGEIVKHALIKDSKYFSWLRNHFAEIQNRTLECLYDMIEKSIQIKRFIVENDPKEQGERALLNFGHTLGHAIEKVKNFELLHGECVAIGCVGATYLSMLRGYISVEELQDIKQMFLDVNLPIQCTGIGIEEVLAVTKSDKKMESGKIKFVLLQSVGHAVIDDTVTDEELRQALAYVL